MPKNVVATRNAPVERMTRAVRRAIELMTREGLSRNDAAKMAGLTPHGLYQALRRPLVKQLYNSELEVLRSSSRARVFHRLEELAAQNENKAAAVAACRAIEELTETPQSRGGAVTSPGLAIVIVDRGSHTTVAPTTFDMKPVHKLEPDDDPAAA